MSAIKPPQLDRHYPISRKNTAPTLAADNYPPRLEPNNLWRQQTQPSVGNLSICMQEPM